jgi:hypothetical protein
LSWGDVSGKPDFANVAVSGSYDDLADAPEVYTQDETYTRGEVDAIADDKVNKSTLTSVVTGAEYSAAGTNVTLTIASYNASADSVSTVQKTVPIASDTQQGVMTKEAYVALQALLTDVAALQQQGGKFIGVSFANKAALDAFTVPGSVNSGDFTYVLDDETQADATTRYVYDGTSFEFAYVINYDPVGIADLSTPGLVKSSEEAGKVFVELDGTMSLNGFDDINDNYVPKERTVAGLDLSANRTVAEIKAALGIDSGGGDAGASGIHRVSAI